MKHHIKNISVLQSSKVFAAIFFALSGCIFFPATLYLLFTGEFGFAVKAFLLPFVYGAMTFIIWAATFFLYNIFSTLVGGIELTLEDLPEERD